MAPPCCTVGAPWWTGDQPASCFLENRGYTGVTSAMWERNLFFMKCPGASRYTGCPASGWTVSTSAQWEWGFSRNALVRISSEFCYVLCLLCLCARLFICALWSSAGKGLTSWLSFVVSTVSLSLPIGIPGQVWYLIVSIPDLCTLTYFAEIQSLNVSLSMLWNKFEVIFPNWLWTRPTVKTKMKCSIILHSRDCNSTGSTLFVR